MRLLNLTLDSPAENLALDEALLLAAEEADHPHEVLRIWDPRQTFVVLGSSSRLNDEVNASLCRSDNVSVLRRPSGGAAILTGPGCLMYAVVLSSERNPRLQAVDLAHRHVLGRLAAAIGRRTAGVREAGTSDLALADRKFSGNSMRCKRRHLLYHGTLLYDFPLALVGRYLKSPPRQPEYRAERTHGDFIVNLPLARDALVECVKRAFDAIEPTIEWPRKRTARLVAEKYSRDHWNHRF